MFCFEQDHEIFVEIDENVMSISESINLTEKHLNLLLQPFNLYFIEYISIKPFNNPALSLKCDESKRLYYRITYLFVVVRLPVTGVIESRMDGPFAGTLHKSRWTFGRPRSIKCRV